MNKWELSIEQKVRRRNIQHLKFQAKLTFQLLFCCGNVCLRVGKTILIRVYKALRLQLNSLLQFCMHEVMDKVYNTPFWKLSGSAKREHVLGINY